MQKKWLSVREAATYCSLSPRLLYLLIGRRQIRFARIGRRIAIDLQDLENFIKERTVEPIDWAKKLLEKRG